MATFHDPKNLAMAIASEAGELLSELRWVASSDADLFVRDPSNRDRIEREVGDVGIAILLFCERAGIDLLDAIERKAELNEINYPVEFSKALAERPAPSVASSGDATTASLPWLVVSVRPLSGFQLDVEFADGSRGKFDYAELIHSDDAGVFAPLRDVKYFNQVRVVDGAVTWPGELDVAPDAMYDRLKASPPNTIIRR